MLKFNPDEPEEFYLESKEDLEDDNPIEDEDLIPFEDFEDEDFEDEDFDDWDED